MHLLKRSSVFCLRSAWRAPWERWSKLNKKKMAYQKSSVLLCLKPEMCEHHPLERGRYEYGERSRILAVVERFLGELACIAQSSDDAWSEGCFGYKWGMWRGWGLKTSLNKTQWGAKALEGKHAVDGTGLHKVTVIRSTRESTVLPQGLSLLPLKNDLRSPNKWISDQRGSLAVHCILQTS